MPCSRGLGDQQARSPRACRAAGGSPCGRPPRAPIAHGLPGSPGRAVTRVVRRPCGWSRRSDGSAAGTARRSPSAAMSGRRASHVAQRAVPACFRRAGAREQLVPGGEARALAVHGERQPGLVPRQQLEVGIAPRPDARQRRVQRRAVALLGIQRGVCDAASAHCASQRASSPLARAAASSHQLLAAQELERTGPAGRLALAQVAAPGLEVIDPGLDACTPSARAWSRVKLPPKRSLPSASIGALAHSRVAGAPVQHPAQHRVVAVGEHVGFDAHRLAHDALDREAPAIDLRRDRFDHGAHAPCSGARYGSLTAGSHGHCCRQHCVMRRAACRSHVTRALSWPGYCSLRNSAAAAAGAG